MEYMTPEIQSLHLAYTTAAGLDLRLTAPFERLWFDCAKDGITPEDIRLVVRWRMKENSANRGNWSTIPHRMLGDDEDRAVFMTQSAMARAELRQRTTDPARASVLAATGRPTVLPDPPARQAKEVILKGLDGLRKAVE